MANRMFRDKDTPGHRKIALAMWIRAVESCEATDFLASRQMFGSAWATLRLAYECSFYFAATFDNPKNAEKLADNHMYQLAKLLKDQIKDKYKEEQYTQKHKDAIAASDKTIKDHKPWSAAEAAKEAGMFDQYSEVFRSISQVGAHANISSLDQHYAKAQDVLLNRGGRPQDQACQIDLTIACLVQGLSRLKATHSAH